MELNPTSEQMKAIRKLERALKACADASIFLKNRYGHIHAWDGNIVEGIYIKDSCNPQNEFPVNENEGYCIVQHGYDFDSLCDDDLQHFIILRESETPKDGKTDSDNTNKRKHEMRK